MTLKGIAREIITDSPILILDESILKAIIGISKIMSLAIALKTKRQIQKRSLLRKVNHSRYILNIYIYLKLSWKLQNCFKMVKVKP